MSDPFVTTSNFAHNAVNEIISGMSALNMEPRPLELTDEQRANMQGFLSETDYWAQHSMVHFHAAIDNLRKVEKQKYAVMDAMRKLSRDMDKDVPLEVREKYFARFEMILDQLQDI